MTFSGGCLLRPGTLHIELAGQRFVAELGERQDVSRPLVDIKVIDLLADLVAGS